MRRILMILVLALAVAPFAVADEAPTADVNPAVEATAAADVVVDEEVSMDEIFAEIEGTHGAQSRYVCPGAAQGECTDNRDCEMFCPANAPQKTCENATGPCTGTCYCC